MEDPPSLMFVVVLTASFIVGLILVFEFGFKTCEQSLYRQYPCTESAIVKGQPTCVRYERKEEEK